MADWKQITARIRRARTSKDPLGQLSALFEKTRDAMVAFELGRYLESTQQNSEALRWYLMAAEKFRRSDWKTKAQEAIARLGGSLPAAEPDASNATDSGSESESANSDRFTLTPPPVTVPEPALPFEANAAVVESLSATELAGERAAAAESPESVPAAKGNVEHRGRRRRGRRGGRNRNRGRDSSDSASISNASRTTPASETPSTRSRSASRTAPALPVETAEELSRPAPKGRYGDPGLSSRLTLLEMQFRRLLSCDPVKLERSDRAPAGPGVFLLTDDDMTSYYYVESCDSLRAAITQLARGGSGKRGTFPVKQQLADHLDIPEARAGKYLNEHCEVRWLQLDEGAPNFAHFAMAVLRPVLNE